MNDKRPPEGPLARSGGPTAGTTIADGTDRYTPHDCIESDIVWGLLAGSIPTPNTPAFRVLLDLAEAMMHRRLAGIRPVLVHSNMWAAIPNRYDDLAQLRDTYDRPPKSAAQIRAEVKHSHARWEREIAERWAS